MKRKNPVVPTICNNKYGRKIVSHPAFGVVQVGRIHTNHIRLFDSDIDHREFVELTVYKAEMDASRETPSPCKGSDMRQPLIQFRLSQAQWAAMVSSLGVGEGVPCTIASCREGDLERMPDIAEQKSIREQYEQRIIATANKEIERLNNQVNELGALLKKGKAGKRELEEIYRSISSSVKNLPGNLAFATELMQESMDKIVSSGKAEVEAYVAGSVMRKGLAAIKETSHSEQYAQTLIADDRND
ncbi:hypothetical protein HVX40_24020 (plasmid) [Escherichia coli]|nr:hypothetical protein [Escherichia coli]MBA8354075.1 hypothetical protein [Escherichia coli]